MRVRGLSALALAASLTLAACSGGSAGSSTSSQPAPTGPAPTISAGDKFEFGVIGDFPYTAEQVPKFDRLIDVLNQEKPALVLHVGDVGAQPCTDAALTASLATINRLTMPVIYTPGDNEWTDCHQSGNDPIQRLARVRQIFFPTDQSLGRTTLTVTRQSANYPENSRFSFGGVTFVALHEVGSNNGTGRTPEADAEAAARQAATIDWIKAGFAAATSANSKGIVLFFQADPNFDLYGLGVHNSHTPFLQELERQSIGFKRPVLLVHGDTHIFRFDKALLGSADRRPIENATRLETFGSPDVHWSRVTVDPSTPELFSAAPAIVESNVVAHTPPP
jgi:predicted phosphodiesterase